MFSEQTQPIETYDKPVDSDFHGDDSMTQCKLWVV